MRVPRSAAGYSLPTTLLLMGVLGTVISIYLASLASSARTTGEVIKRRQAFYTCDGLTKMMSIVSREYFQSTENPTTAGLQQHICDTVGCNLENVTPGAYEVLIAQVHRTESDTDLVPNGPFAGMNARLNTVELEVEAVATLGNQTCRVSEEITFGDIGLFQFFAFSEHALDLGNCAPTTVSGRVHANGDFCGGCQNNNGKIERVTASGKVLRQENCGRYNGNASRKIFFKDKDSGSWVQLLTDATSPTWKAYAESVFHGNVQDESHGVPHLRLPFSNPPQMQAGLDAQKTAQNDGEIHDNANTQRYFIDPVLQSDSSQVRDQKLAWKADIRIINGVWYKNNGSWPGQPIWSDHPGRTKRVAESYLPADPNFGSATADEWAVGQENIRDDLALGRTPEWFSYYEANAAGQLTGDTKGVISYGSLHRDGSGAVPVWRPGHWVTQVAGGSASDAVCAYDEADDEDGDRHPLFSNSALSGVEGKIANATKGGTGAVNCFSKIDSNGTAGIQADDNVVEASQGSLYLESARSGFTDGRVAFKLGGHKARILPINFDLAAFTAAMQDTRQGELGSYFNGGATFNGIVWIGSTWQNQMNSPTPGTLRPQLWPNNVMGSPAESPDPYSGTKPYQDPVLPTISGARFIPTGSAAANLDHQRPSMQPRHAQQALPFPLCGTDLADGAHYFNDGDELFTIPHCETESANLSRPNAVRLINARDVPKAVFAKGLTVSTNLPGYMLGSLNQSSNVEADWVPFLFANDATSGLSNNWRDDRAPWWEDAINSPNYPNTQGKRPAADTYWRTAIFTGHVWPVGNGHPASGLQNWVRYLEDWGASTKVCGIDGSLVIGHSSVFENQPFKYADIAFKACIRQFNYDTKFDLVSNQPPGTPTFAISATRTWDRD